MNEQPFLLHDWSLHATPIFNHHSLAFTVKAFKCHIMNHTSGS